MKKNALLSPSLLSADFSNLGTALKMIEDKGGSLVHIDVMDGHFVPPVSYGQPVIASLRSCTKLPFDVHLMVERPELCISSFVDAGADYVTFHAEATAHADRCIQMIHERGKKAGIAICPTTPVSSLEHILPSVDLVLVMTVNPGWGGQKLISYTVDKVKTLAALQEEKKYTYLISVDGGINAKTLPIVLDAGTDIVVSGSAFFEGKLPW
ncbi:MAG: ribulose-phosphate 3-epimerase [Treponema sp.]|nr:ribulose-phosphate 3-epimerase [Treponema sp.]